MNEESPATYTELAVAIGRVEEGIKGLKDSVDELVHITRTHSEILTQHQVDIEILKSRQSPRIHWLTILVGVISTAAFVLALLDRFYR